MKDRDWIKDNEGSKPGWLSVDAADRFRSAMVRSDGCIHYSRHYNEPGGDGDDDHLHICDIDEEIDRLQRLKQVALAHFGDDWGH